MKSGCKTLILLLLLAREGAAGSQPAEAAGGWQWLEVSGDLRLRYETIDIAGAADTERGRVRGRLDLAAHATGDLTVVLRVATNDGSPVSDNLTLGDGFSADDVGVVRAFLDWRVNDTVRLQAGRMTMPWYRAGGNGLLWDSDFDPEGVAASFTTGRYFGSLATLTVGDRPGADSLLVSAQGGVRVGLAEGAGLSAGLGFHDYGKTAGYPPFHDGRGRGNSVDASGNLVNDYALVEAFADYGGSFGDVPFTLFGQWIRNTAADTGRTAFAAGFGLGDARSPGDVELSYAWRDTGADAVIATFNDSDFAGGATHARGHRLKGTLRVMERLELGATIIAAKVGELDVDYERVMLDVVWSFE